MITPMSPMIGAWFTENVMKTPVVARESDSTKK
jgi:hypothetical protein